MRSATPESCSAISRIPAEPEPLSLMPGADADAVEVGAHHDDVVRIARRRLGDHVARRVGPRPPVDLEAGLAAGVAVLDPVGQRLGRVVGRGHRRDVDPGDVEPQRDGAPGLALVEEDHAAGARPVRQLELGRECALAALHERDRPVRHPVVVGRLAAAGAAVDRRGRVEVEVDRPHRRGDVRRARVVHRAEVAPERPAAIPGTNASPPSDRQHRRRVVGEEVQVVLEVVEGDVHAGGFRPVGHVEGRGVVAGRSRQPVAARRVGDPVERGLVLQDPRRTDRGPQLLRVVVARVGGRDASRGEKGERRNRARKPTPTHESTSSLGSWREDQPVPGGLSIRPRTAPDSRFSARLLQLTGR